MKITCQSCQAKYTIADEKVLGKIVKIRCKKCSSTIVVNGSDASGSPSYGAPEGGGEYAASGADEGWTVNVADGDQRTMTDAEIIAAYQAGVVGTETFCWKDGMSDWLPLREIDALYEACNATRAVAASAPPSRSSARVQGRAGAAPSADYAAAASGNGAANAANGGAARKAGRAPGADLFQGAAQAGGEEEVMTSAPVGAPQSYDEQKPTGARNENSVLFSLSALTSKGNDRPPPVPGVEASGLIDIRQLSAQMGRGDDKKRSRVDDIMNLSSGGAFNGALSAPVMSAPAIDQYGGPAADAAAGGAVGGQGKSKALIFLALGAGAFVIVAAIGATMLMMHGKGTDADSTAASASAAAAAAGLGTAAATSATVAATAATAPAAASAPAPEATAAATDTAAPSAPAAAATAAAAPTVAAAPVAAAPAAPRPQAAAAPAAPAHTAAPAPAAASEDQPFNMGEAKSKLAAAAAAAQSCKKGDGPVGTGRVVVVFAPSGGAQTATLAGPPFDGTPTGACVAARFRGVHVPPFSGSPFSVSKSFTIN
jgi:predicted Zn finger-like uncharacterized protein